MLSDAILRPARPGDGPALARLVHELAAFEKLSDQCRLTAEAAEATLTGGLPWVRAWVVELDGALVGYAVGYSTFSTFLGRAGLYLEDLYVSPAARGRGIGRALLDEVKATAEREDCGRLEWTVLDWNVPAREFYKRFGAREHSEWVLCRMAL